MELMFLIYGMMIYGRIILMDFKILDASHLTCSIKFIKVTNRILISITI